MFLATASAAAIASIARTPKAASEINKTAPTTLPLSWSIKHDLENKIYCIKALQISNYNYIYESRSEKNMLSHNSLINFSRRTDRAIWQRKNHFNCRTTIEV